MSVKRSQSRIVQTLLVLLITVRSAVAADVWNVQVSLPLNGSYQIGRYMPVRIVAPPAQQLRVECEGCVSVSIDAAGNATDLVIPLLILAAPTAITISDGHGNMKTVPLTLQPLAADQRLIGTVGKTDHNAPENLFPGSRHITIDLDPAHPLPGTPAAWELLFAVVAPGDATRSQEVEAFNMLRHDLVGPASALTEAAYAPVRAWSPGLPSRSRTMIFSFGILTAIALLAPTLARRKSVAILGVTILATGATLLLLVWQQRQPSQREAEGAISIYSGSSLQRDVWSYRSTASENAEISCDWTGQFCRATFTSPGQARRQNVCLHVDSTGQPKRWSARPQRGEHLAVLSRTVEPAQPMPRIVGTATSPMLSLARQAYVAPGTEVTAQASSRSPDDLGEVFLKRDAR